tara:strand:+ start:274 stop:642 length:369 start_codon:yes stop_codon:yes gene_type:complete
MNKATHKQRRRKMKEKSIEDWVRKNISPSERKEVLEHGCVNGCVPQLIYYKDTCAFYDYYQNEIWDMLYDAANNYGSESILHFIASLNGAKDVGSDDQLSNLLAWWAVEETCYQLQAKEDAA